MKSLLKITGFFAAFMLAAAYAGGPVVASAGGSASSKPYQIIVDKETQILTVLSKDDQGNYTVVDRQMVCSTARQGRTTPTGMFRISMKKRWLYSPASKSHPTMYEQYACRINPDSKIWIHSTCFLKEDPYKMESDSYEGLGSPASAGCVRVSVADAKWIFENCPSGTVVRVVKSGGPAAQCVEKLPPLPAGATYDPTDPAVLQDMSAGNANLPAASLHPWIMGHPAP